jgi:hypothetical protein
MFSSVATVFLDMVDGTTSVAAKLEEGVLQRRREGAWDIITFSTVATYGGWNTRVLQRI